MKIRALLVSPMEHPKIVYLSPTKQELICTLGGTEELESKKIAKNIYAVYDGEAFLLDAEPNRKIGKSIIVGNLCIVVTDDYSVPISLTDEQLLTYAVKFWNVEEFENIDVTESNINAMMTRLTKYE